MKSLKILFLSISTITLSFSQINSYPIELIMPEWLGKEHQDENGDTPLHKIAEDCKSSNYTVQKILRLGSIGVNPWSKNNNGKTASHIAQEKCDLPECEKLTLILKQVEQNYLENALSSSKFKLIPDETTEMDKKNSRKFIKCARNLWTEIEKA